MHLMTILGSPRLEGNTAYLLTAFEDQLRRQGHTFGRVNLQLLRINGCRECLACQQKGAPIGCVMQDDMAPIYGDLLKADGFVLATPVFMWSYTAQAKAFMDRLYALCPPSGPQLAGKKSALLITGGGDMFDGADLIVQGFLKYAVMNQLDHKGQVAAAPMQDGVLDMHFRDAAARLARTFTQR